MNGYRRSKITCLLLLALAGLFIIFTYQSWRLFNTSIEQAFVLDFINTFVRIQNAVESGELTRDEAAAYIKSYYPAGTKLTKGSATSNAVENLRSNFIFGLGLPKVPESNPVEKRGTGQSEGETER
jgi:hypothetical protein